MHQYDDSPLPIVGELFGWLLQEYPARKGHSEEEVVMLEENVQIACRAGHSCVWPEDVLERNAAEQEVDICNGREDARQSRGSEVGERWAGVLGQQRRSAHQRRKNLVELSEQKWRA